MILGGGFIELLCSPEFGFAEGCPHWLLMIWTHITYHKALAQKSMNCTYIDEQTIAM